MDSFLFQLFFVLNLQAVGHQTAQTLEVNLLGDVFGLDGLLLLDDGDDFALKHPIVLLHPLLELLVVDVAEKLRQVDFVDGLEGGADDVADEFPHRVLKLNHKNLFKALLSKNSHRTQ